MAVPAEAVASAVAAWSDSQHLRGRLTARERIEVLLDEDSISELGSSIDADGRPGNDGVITVRGSIGGRAVCVFAKDVAEHGGTLTAMHARKITRLQALALQTEVPVIGIFDSAGLRLESGMDGLSGYGEIVRNAAAASGVVPQISLIVGACSGADALLPPLSDFVFMANEDSSLFLCAPDVIERVTGEALSDIQLGGPQVHSTMSSLADGVFDNELDALRFVRQLVSLLPMHRLDAAAADLCLDEPHRESPALDTLVPQSEAEPYDVKELLSAVSDGACFLELQSAFAPNAVIGFARMGGRVVGLVANQSAALAGVIDGNAARKIARFVRFCDAFGIAVLSFVDTPGFLPSADQEHAGIVRHVAKLFSAYAQATVPLITVVLRKAFGAAGGAMGSRPLGADVVYAWPEAQIGLLSAQGAVALGDDPQAARERLAAAAAARRGDVDDVIAPRQTRRHLLQALSMLAQKSSAPPWRKHANLPL